VYSKQHALVAGVVGLGVAAVAPDPTRAALAWGYVVALGVGVDVDHFLIARLNRGDWTNLRRVLADPALVVRAPDAIFDAGDVWRDQRLLSHALLGGALTPLAALVGPLPALATVASLYTHLVADLYADARSRESYLRRAAGALETGPSAGDGEG
jgi:hypothetical protein